MERFDDLIHTGRDADALRYLADEYYKNGKMGHTRKRLLERAAETLERLQKELASLAIESVNREMVLAKLEAEVMAAVNRQGEWISHKKHFFKCSLCKTNFNADWNFCPNCGAKMYKEDTP